MGITNNDILVRVRYALNLKDQQMQEIFQLGGMEFSVAEVQKMLIKVDLENQESITEYYICNNSMLDCFLNGLITFKRGKQQTNPNEPPRPPLAITNPIHLNNVVLKKLKTALSLTSDDILDILKKAGVEISKTELSAVLRKEGERHYKVCGDRYLRNFLKGLAMKYRNQ